ncbi:hypothetical protein F2P79_019892 [Pimephales promelas]|nr:hypothetical protein F2P79_019892 [Pimephales promelas]
MAVEQSAVPDLKSATVLGKIFPCGEMAPSGGCTAVLQLRLVQCFRSCPNVPDVFRHWPPVEPRERELESSCKSPDVISVASVSHLETSAVAGYFSSFVLRGRAEEERE